MVDRCRYLFDPRVVAALQHWAEISQRLRRNRDVHLISERLRRIGVEISNASPLSAGASPSS
jgi:hypothetical protein